MIKRLAIASYLFSAVLISCGSSGNNSETTDSTDTAMNTESALSSDDANKDAWVSLFDGEKIEGWHSYGKPNTVSSWKVADGVLYLDTTKTGGKREEGDLITDKEYENFHLSLDWKLAQGGNSGIIFLVKEDSSKYKRTYETG